MNTNINININTRIPFYFLQTVCVLVICSSFCVYFSFVRVCRCVGFFYLEFNSLMAWGMKLLQNLAVLHLTLQNLLPELSSVNSPWGGCVESLVMLLALVRQRMLPMSRMEGREVPMIFSAVLTSLWRLFQSAAVQLPHHTEIQVVIIDSMVLL